MGMRAKAYTSGSNSELVERIELDAGAENVYELPLDAPPGKLRVSAELQLTADHYVSTRPVDVTVRLYHGADLIERSHFTITGDQHHHMSSYFKVVEHTGQKKLVLKVRASASYSGTLIVGHDGPDRKVTGDTGRLNALWHIVPPYKREKTRRRRRRRFPSDKQRRVIYSKKVVGLREGDQVEVKALVRARARNAPTRVSTRVFLADSPDQAQPNPKHGHASTLARYRAEPCEDNGMNEKGLFKRVRYGVFEVVRDQEQAVFLNLSVQVADPYGYGPTSIKVRRRGFLRLLRWRG